MRKKLNRKLRFALVGFGAFALAGVSCFGLASLESQDAIASYAIDTPTDGNPVEHGIFTFSYSDNSYYVSWAQPIVINGLPISTDRFSLAFLNDSFNSPYGAVGAQYEHFTLSDGTLTLEPNTYSINNPDFSNISNYWVVSVFQSSYSTIRFSTVSYSEFTINNGSSPFITEPVLPPQPPTPVDYVHDIVDILVAGITKLGQGIGQGVSSFVQSLAFNSAGDGLSVYFVLVCVFGGIALAVALTSKIFMWLSGLGA